MGLAYELRGCLVSFFRLFRVAVPKPIKYLKLHLRSGKILGQAVVNLVGDDLSFVVAGLEHSPERLSLPFQSLLCFVTFSNVVEKADPTEPPL